MNLELKKVSPQEWQKLAPHAHKISFHEDRALDMDRISYALMVVNEKDPCSYSTIIELDRKSAYMQHGGAFPNITGTTYVLRSYMMMMNWLKENYEMISTRIFARNKPMIKLALMTDLEIVGTENNEGETILIWLWKKKKVQ